MYKLKINQDYIIWSGQKESLQMRGWIILYCVNVENLKVERETLPWDKKSCKK